MSEKTCGTCRWWGESIIWHRDDCTWRLRVPKKKPMWFMYLPPARNQQIEADTDATDCDCWRERDDE